MKEIEILYALQEPIAAAKRKFGKADWRTTRVKDTYFESKDHARLSPGTDHRLTSSFRLREKDNSCKLTYKDDRFDTQGTWLYSDEHEVGVSDAGVMKAIAKALRFRELITIDNKKHLCDIDGYEIALEEVKGLGNFIEIEYKGKKEIPKKQVETLKGSMRAYLEAKRLKLGEELNAGKPELMLKKNKKEGTTVPSARKKTRA